MPHAGHLQSVPDSFKKHITFLSKADIANENQGYHLRKTPPGPGPFLWEWKTLIFFRLSSGIRWGKAKA